MHVFINFFYITALLMVTGCSSSRLQMHDDNQLIISNDQTTIEVTTPYMESYKINMSPVVIDQHIISVEESRCIVYEEIRTIPGYRFNYTYKRSIDLIFDAYSVEELKRYGNLTLYRVTLRDEKRTVLNLLALTASKQSLKFVYGFDDKALTMLKESLGKGNASLKYALSMDTSRRDHCVQSKWQPKLLIMDNLVGKEGGKIKGVRH
ncbi:MAG: hypothetical protein PF439_10675 [Helicobacteraceae bacterium]|jgi:hypothetical protein|nr:hypothetical protein [Helicobacteraceae bacterium]